MTPALRKSLRRFGHGLKWTAGGPGSPLRIFALVTSLMFTPEHYRAADKLTKPVWLVILGVGVLLALVLGITGVAIAAVAAGVYLVDVRPKILEIQGKSR